MKRLVFWGLYLLGVPSLFRHIHRKSLTIVLYHGVAPQVTGRPDIYNYRGKFVTPGQFERHLAYFKKHYRVLPLDTALDHMHEGTLPENALAITFDDGYRNFYDHTLPLLKQEGLPATMYLATDFVVRGKPLWVDRLEYACGKRTGSYAERVAYDARARDELKKLPPAVRDKRLTDIVGASGASFHDFEDDRTVYAPLTRAQILECEESGLVTFGAHTRSHPILATMHGEEQDAEIQGSREDLEAWGIRVSPTFAYPNGHPSDWNKNTLGVLKGRGFSRSVTTIEGTNTKTTDPYQLHRMVLDATDSGPKFANVVTGVRLFLNRLRLS